MLTAETRENIINSLETRKFQNCYNDQPEHTMNFDECDDDELIYYRDEWLASEFDLNNDEDLNDMQCWYDEDIFKYWE